MINGVLADLVRSDDHTDSILLNEFLNNVRSVMHDIILFRRVSC